MRKSAAAVKGQPRNETIDWLAWDDSGAGTPRVERISADHVHVVVARPLPAHEFVGSVAVSASPIKSSLLIRIAVMGPGMPS
jgi:hypothetical protein